MSVVDLSPFTVIRHCWAPKLSNYSSTRTSVADWDMSFACTYVSVLNLYKRMTYPILQLNYVELLSIFMRDLVAIETE